MLINRYAELEAFQAFYEILVKHGDDPAVIKEYRDKINQLRRELRLEELKAGAVTEGNSSREHG